MRQGCVGIDLGNGAHAIACGCKGDHECDSVGPVIYEWSDGDSGTLFDKAVKEGLYPGMCDEDKRYFLWQRGIDMGGMSVSCSVCERLAINDMCWM